MQPKKSLGQHFLKSFGAITAIIEAAKISPDDTILEIGPGEGILTEELLKHADRVIAVEKDSRLIPFLKQKFPNLEIIEGDILETNLETQLNLKKYKVIGNIPYYITGQIFRKYIEMENQPESMTLLIQKEVAERILTKDGKESLLSLSVKAYGIPKIIKVVPRGSFTPIPKVDSAILHISDISRKNFKNANEQDFFKIIHLGFSHKRKVLLSNLSAEYPKEKLIEAFEKVNLDQKVRAENVPLHKWLELTKFL